jgi:hypothetical protein
MIKTEGWLIVVPAVAVKPLAQVFGGLNRRKGHVG